MTGNEFIDGVVKVSTALTPFAIAWIGYKQVKMNKKQDIIHKQINGQQELLLKATGQKERAEGKEEGKSEQRAEGKTTATEVIKQIQDNPDIEITKT